MITAERLHQGVSHRANILPRLGQLRTGGEPTKAVKSTGELIEVRTDLAEMAEKAR
jgi:hypothetical protein